MAVSVHDVREEVRCSTSEAETAILTRCLAQAVADVDKYLADNEVVVGTDLPAAKYDEAVIAAAADAYRLKKAPNGVVNQQFDAGNGEVASAPVRISRDPLRSVRPVLAMWIGPAFA